MLKADIQFILGIYQVYTIHHRYTVTGQDPHSMVKGPVKVVAGQHTPIYSLDWT